MFCTVLPTQGMALPAGRSWAPTTELRYPRVQHFRAERLEVDSVGAPLLIVGAQRDASGNTSESSKIVLVR